MNQPIKIHKSPLKLFSQLNRNRYYKSLRTGEKKISPISPPSLFFITVDSFAKNMNACFYYTYLDQEWFCQQVEIGCLPILMLQSLRFYLYFFCYDGGDTPIATLSNIFDL